MQLPRHTGGVDEDTEATDPAGYGWPRPAFVLIGEPAAAVLSAFSGRDDLEAALLRAQCGMLRLENPPIEDGLIVGRVFRFAPWTIETLPDAIAVILSDSEHPTGFGFDLAIEDEPDPELLALVRSTLSTVHPNFAAADFVLLAP